MAVRIVASDPAPETEAGTAKKTKRAKHGKRKQNPPVAAEDEPVEIESVVASADTESVGEAAAAIQADGEDDKGDHPGKADKHGKGHGKKK